MTSCLQLGPAAAPSAAHSWEDLQAVILSGYDVVMSVADVLLAPCRGAQQVWRGVFADHDIGLLSCAAGGECGDRPCRMHQCLATT